jgi:hypothetical protein
MEDTYVIIWVAKDRMGEGVGTKRFSRADAEMLADQLNQEHTGFAHKAVNTATEKIKEALHLLKSQAMGLEPELVNSDVEVRVADRVEVIDNGSEIAAFQPELQA